MLQSFTSRWIVWLCGLVSRNVVQSVNLLPNIWKPEWDSLTPAFCVKEGIIYSCAWKGMEDHSFLTCPPDFYKRVANIQSLHAYYNLPITIKILPMFPKFPNSVLVLAVAAFLNQMSPLYPLNVLAWRTISACLASLLKVHRQCLLC